MQYNHRRCGFSAFRFNTTLLMYYFYIAVRRFLRSSMLFIFQGLRISFERLESVLERYDSLETTAFCSIQPHDKDSLLQQRGAYWKRVFSLYIHLIFQHFFWLHFPKPKGTKYKNNFITNHTT